MIAAAIDAPAPANENRSVSDDMLSHARNDADNLIVAAEAYVMNPLTLPLAFAFGAIQSAAEVEALDIDPGAKRAMRIATVTALRVAIGEIEGCSHGA